ncbi:hypothetical protein [Mycoplana dimorpha]|uniref:Uncharacterized protein n=1 Tax=Mycoplana dimorpha TaxID=28320 RepID=A0A2T5BBL4_MYCDI|nr:hypothetical protein [Mycoplana dimorpha]PTM96368.1 hypothetical protein C7449_103386 [Mycoplana dimorpha]
MTGTMLFGAFLAALFYVRGCRMAPGGFRRARPPAPQFSRTPVPGRMPET